MPLVALSHVSHRYGGPEVLHDVTLAVEKGRKIGVIGQNGTGKSTLLDLLAGRIEPREGEVFRQRGTVVAHQAQELTYEPGASVLAEMRRVFGEDLVRAERLTDLEHRLGDGLGESEQRRLLAEYERLQHEHQAAGGYDVDRRIATVLSRLGLPESAWEQPVERFSGGERNVIGLASVLLSRPDVMLLDEPSNHLDLDGIEWFVEFVRGTDAAVVVVSHNRYLLDAIAQEIWEVRRHEVTTWTGNYTAFREQKAKALDLQERRYKSQQRLIERIEFQARRLNDMANAYDDPAQAKRAKSMLRRVERMEKVERPDRIDRVFKGSLAGAERHGRMALSVNDFTFHYGDRVILEKASAHLEYGDRVCLVGPNGSGKTTLFRQILEHGSWDDPTLRLGKGVRVGEYRQLHQDALDPGAGLRDWVMEATGLARSDAAALLHRFLFTRDDLDRTIATLSGGEKSRLQLARLVHEKVNFLFLDEPTNHLDIPACEQLEEMLQAFQGTLFVISHDRYFLARLVTRVVELRDRKLHLFHGGFEAWWESRQGTREKRRGALELGSRKAAAGDAKEAARREREDRKARERERRRLTNRVARLEEAVEALETRRTEILDALQEAYGSGADAATTRALNDDLAQLGRDLDERYGEWDSATESLEGS